MQLAENQDHKRFTEGKKFAEHEDLRIKHLFFHQPSIASTYDSAENIVTTPPDSDLDDVYLQEREANAEQSQVYHSERENLMSNSSQDPTNRRFSLQTSTSFWKQRTFLQILQPGKCCEISS